MKGAEAHLGMKIIGAWGLGGGETTCNSRNPSWRLEGQISK